MTVDVAIEKDYRTVRACSILELDDRLRYPMQRMKVKPVFESQGKQQEQQG